MNTLHLNLLTGSPLESTQDAKRFLEIWVEFLPNLIFDRYGNYEPLRESFDPANIEAALAFWKMSFQVEKKKPRLSGSIHRGGLKIPTHGWVVITMNFRQKDQEEVLAFAKKVATEFGVQFGFVHLMTPQEFKGNDYAKGLFAVSSDHTFPLLVTTHELRKYVPNIYWGTFFGPDYVNFFGEEKFSTLPACVSSERLGDELYYLQMSDQVSDLETELDSINDCREKVKLHLNNNAFYNPQHPPDHVYNKPLFKSILNLSE